MRKAWLKKHRSTIILGIIFLIGLSLLLYPSVSNYWNSFHQSQTIASYAEAVAKLEDVDYDKMIQEAKGYNERLAKKPNRWFLSKEDWKEYNSLLDVGENGIIGYIEIPTIKVSLPIYHGIDEATLQIAIGHIEGTSLPVGGKGSHSVLSGHRGLPSAKLFSNLDQMREGDLFMLRVLDETLTYEVDQILIVEPDDLSALEIEKGKDLCTLVTCTPYGVNSHRLLVRGHRVANQDGDGTRVTADALQIDPVLVAPVVALPMLLIFMGWVIIYYRRKK